jgi:uncharacterized repeat protein (TIGR03803 family)
LTPSGEETVLYAFKGGSDGQNPAAGLIADNKGNLYGTTEEGGPRDAGTVFKISPDGSETLLHSFCSQRDCEDGAVPVAGLIADKSGNLYGTTEDGGAFCRGFLGCGTVFRISPDGTETVVHSFPGGFLGEYPCGSLTADGKGNFYGTTSYGGAYDYGTVFVMGQ